MSFTRVEQLEARALFAATAPGVYPFGDATPAGPTLTLEDADGSTVRFSLTRGAAAVTVSDGGAWSLAVTSSRPTSALSAEVAGGDGRTVLSGLTVSGPLGRLLAPAVDLRGATATLGGATTAVTLGAVDDSSLTAAGAVRSLSVASWTASGPGAARALSAPSLGALAVAGDFAADLTLGIGRGTVLGSATVAGTSSGTWSVNGNAGRLTFARVAGPVTVTGNTASFTTSDHLAVGTPPGGDQTTLARITLKGRSRITAGGTPAFATTDVTFHTTPAPIYGLVDLYGYDGRYPVRTYRYSGYERGTFQIVTGAERRPSLSSFYANDWALIDGAPGNDTQYFARQSPDAKLSAFQASESMYYEYANAVIAPPVLVPGNNYRTSSATFIRRRGSPFADGTTAFSVKLVGYEQVSTPAGRLLTVKISETSDFSGVAEVRNRPERVRETVVRTRWCAAGIGIVRSVLSERLTSSFQPLNGSATTTATLLP